MSTMPVTLLSFFRPLAVNAPYALAAVLAAFPALAAQQRIGDGRAWRIGPVFESWRLDTAATVTKAEQWSVPVTAAVPLGSRWTLDAYLAYASGTITIPSGQAGAGTHELSGMTDAKLRASARLGGDRILATVGLNIPTGKTGLDSTELRALRVLGAPALRFQTPGLGSGVSGTTGLVVTQMFGDWAWGVGASYEYRGAYSPAESFAAGTGAPDLDPGEAVRVSLGADGFVGQHQMSLSISSTFYTEDHVSFQTATGPQQHAVRLGPPLVAEWQLRFASHRVRDLTLYAYDRYRTNYERDGVRVNGTSGNELDFGAHGAVPFLRHVSLLVGASGRHHTGLKVDETLSTAAILSGGVQLGLSLDVGGGLVIQPLAGVEFATIGTGTQRFPANKLEFAIAIGTR